MCELTFALRHSRTGSVMATTDDATTALVWAEDGETVTVEGEA